MVDIAQLAFEVDSSGLVAAEKALDRLAARAAQFSGAGASLEQNFESTGRAAQSSASSMSAAMAEQEGRLRAVAQRGVEFAESMRGANVSERALAEAAREAAAGIDVKAQVMARAGTLQEQMAQRAEALRQAEARAAAETEKAAKAHALQELNLKRLLGQIDPTIGRLDRLAQMEGTLEKALDMGAINPEIFTQYQAKIDATRAATLNAGKASDIMTASIGGLNLQAVETQQSIAALGRALVTGQWGQAQASVTSLTARTGLMGGAFTAAGAAVAGTGLALGTFAVMAGKGYIESRQLEGVIIGMGGAAGVTTGQMLDLRNEIARASGDYAGATQVVNQLILSGKLTGSMLEGVAKSSSNLARLTGQSIGSIASEIEVMAAGGSEELARLDEKYNFLTLSTYKHIEALREQEGDFEANKLAVQELERVMDERAAKMVQSAGNVERAWHGVTGAVNGAIQELKDWGRQDLERQIEEARRAVNAAGSTRDGPVNAGLVALRERELAALLEQKRAQDLVNAAMAEEARFSAQSKEAYRQRRAEEHQAEEAMNRQLQTAYGLDTAVNRLEMTFAAMSEERQKAMVADGRYQMLLSRAMEEDAKRNERRKKDTKEKVSDEEKAEQRLLARFENQAAAMEREITLYGDKTRSAGLAYDIELTGLRLVNPKLAEKLELQARILDQLATEEEVLARLAKLDQERWDDQFKKKTDDMSEYAKQAARNMQSHFADFLFDPFAEGSQNMADQFSETLRRMMAEAASAKFFEMIGTAMSGYGGQGWWGNLVRGIGGAIQSDGGREYGGSVYSRGMYQVGERNKPELLSTPNGQYLIPGDSGRVDPIRAAPAPRGGGSGPMQVVINNNAPVQVDAREERQTMPDGSEIRRLIIDVVGESLNGGTLGQIGKGRYGWRDQV